MTSFRTAGPDEAAALLEVERAASLAALAHVFPPQRYPYPDVDVLARWELVLADPEVTVEVAGAPGELVAVVAYDRTSVRHLAVRPEAWGHGWGSAALSRAEAAMAASGAATAMLWVLRDNDRARGWYERRGWRATGVTREAPWPPYPPEWEYAVRVRRPEPSR